MSHLIRFLFRSVSPTKLLGSYLLAAEIAQVWTTIAATKFSCSSSHFPQQRLVFSKYFHQRDTFASGPAGYPILCDITPLLPCSLGPHLLSCFSFEIPSSLAVDCSITYSSCLLGGWIKASIGLLVMCCKHLSLLSDVFMYKFENSTAARSLAQIST